MLARRLALFLRIALGVVFAYAAYTKLRQPLGIFALSIDSYQMLPETMVFALAYTLPWCELALGVLLIAGLWLRYTSWTAAALLTAFFTMMAIAYARGLGIDCGCFGVGEALSPATLARDSALLAAAFTLAWLTWRRHSCLQRRDSSRRCVG
jgi:uncharacterized membrane protein YphA (DoxX/SURF4 family)